MKVLLTGVAGFIGMHSAQRLLARGDEVIGVDNLNPYYPVQLKKDRLAQLKHPKLSFHELNIAQFRRLLDLLTRDERLDVVRAFHHINRAIEASTLDARTDRKEPAR